MHSVEELVGNIPHHLADDIIANPRFNAARKAYVDAALRLYEHEPSLNRLMHEVGRMVIFCVVMCLDARHDETDRATWLTMGRLKETLGQFEVASPRQVDQVIGRLTSTGYLQLAQSPGDRRTRIVKPTDKMLAHDQDWLTAHFAPLDLMFPIPGYAQPMNRDPDFQKAQRQASIAIFPWSARIMSENAAMMLFLMRHAGVLILMKLFQMMEEDEDRVAKGLSYSDIGARFDVSRTHVRSLMQEAQQLGLVQLSGRGGQLVQLLPSLIAAFDRFVADSMSAHDWTYRIAISQLEAARSAA